MSTRRQSDYLFVCQVFHPDEQATSQLFSDLFGRLAAEGARITVLCGRPRGEGVPAEERWRGILVCRGGMQVDGKRSLLHRGVAYASYSLWLAAKLLGGAGRGARLLAVTNPPFAPVLVWLCAAARGRPFSVFLLDVYPDGLVALGVLGESSLVTRLWRWANRRALDAAEQVLVLGRDMAEVCERRYGVPPEKIRYFPHWSPTDAGSRRRAEDTALWRKLPQLAGRFVVQYSGNMGLWHDLETIVRAAGLLRDDPGIHFLMIGGGLRREAAEELGRALAPDSITWLPYQPKDQLDDSLACCHAALISQRSGLSGVAVPCKLYGVLSSGRAALAQVPRDSEAARVVAEEDCGWVIEPGDAAGLATAILAAAADREVTDRRGENAFSSYQRKYTLEHAVENFFRLMAAPDPSR